MSLWHSQRATTAKTTLIFLCILSSKLAVSEMLYLWSVRKTKGPHSCSSSEPILFYCFVHRNDWLAHHKYSTIDAFVMKYVELRPCLSTTLHPNHRIHIALAAPMCILEEGKLWRNLVRFHIYTRSIIELVVNIKNRSESRRTFGISARWNGRHLTS